MHPEQQSRVVVVLIRARNPSNIGAVARAMHDLGYTRLRIVNEYPVPFAAAKSAVDASSVLEAATEHTGLAEALADCTLVLGTTAVGERVLEHPLYLLPQAAPVVTDALSKPEARVALLFGSEKTGLSNEELSHCHALVTIPMNTPADGHHLSMNLGQAAAVCLYQLAIEPSPEATVDPDPLASGDSPVSKDPLASGDPQATGAELDRIHTLFREVLDDSGYSRRNPANSRETATRRLLLRMRLTTTDATVWTGILRQLLHAIRR